MNIPHTELLDLADSIARDEDTHPNMGVRELRGYALDMLESYGIKYYKHPLVTKLATMAANRLRDMWDEDREMLEAGGDYF